LVVGSNPTVPINFYGIQITEKTLPFGLIYTIMEILILTN